MTRFGLDYAWGRIPASAHHAVGSTFAARYHSHDASKNLTPGEAAELRAGGVDIVSIWESTASRSAQGAVAGAIDARTADAQARWCGMPPGRPIYFAVDFDASPGQVINYFRGAADALGVHRVGCYAGVRVIDGLFSAGVISYGWQTYAWSYGRVSRRAQLYQYSNGHYVAGVDCDFNRSLADDFGQWGVHPTPPPQEAQVSISSALNKDGRIEVFVEAKDGSIWHTWQTAPDNGWQGAVAGQHAATLYPLAPAPPVK